MNILLATFAGSDQTDLGRYLASLGHTVVCATNQADVFNCLDTVKPDCVLLDADTSQLGGIAFAEAMIQRSGDANPLPVILLSGQFAADTMSSAFAVGCDSCFPKPIDLPRLGSRIAILSQRANQRRECLAQTSRLAALVATEEENFAIARHLIEHQLEADGNRLNDDPAVKYWHHSCARMGGDIFAMGRTPSGTLHVLLADAREHGLLAYVSLMPIINPFYRMTEKGFPLGSIVRELNRKVRLTLPHDRRVAAQLLAVDQRENVVSIWNGGMPPAYVLDVFGRRSKASMSSHDSLGELADELFDDRIDQHILTPEEQIVLVSDGVLDCAGLEGVAFGERGLADALLGQPRHKRYEETITSIRTHMGEQDPRDDMTLVLIDCESKAPAHTPQVSDVSGADNAGNWSFEIRLGVGEIGHQDVVPLLLHVIGQFGLKGDWNGKLFIVFSELFNNALDHGILKLDSKIKDRPDGMEAWLNLREERLRLLQEGEVRLSVAQFTENGMVKLKLACQDSGAGFDVARVLQRIQQMHAQNEENVEPFGRGLLLIHSLADSVDYAENGRIITVLFTIGTIFP